MYEVGLPNQGIAILYNILNQAEGIPASAAMCRGPIWVTPCARRAFRCCRSRVQRRCFPFDIVGMHVPHEMAVTNFLEALDLAGIPLLAADRPKTTLSSSPAALGVQPRAVRGLFDAILIGEGEESLLETCQLHRRLRDEGVRARRLSSSSHPAGNYVPSLCEVRHDEPCSPHGYTVPREARTPTVVYKRVVEDFGARIRCRSRACLCAARSRPPVYRDPARLRPRLPFLPGRHDVSSGTRALGRPNRVVGDSGSGKDRL
ncbi:MAG: hypothetical protein ACLU37_03225 [Collinsella sp.]